MAKPVDGPSGTRGRAAQQSNKFQQMIFSALAKRGLQKQGATAYRPKPQERSEPHANDRQSGTGFTGFESDRRNRVGVYTPLPLSGLRNSVCVLESQQCESIVRGHKVMDQRCSRKAPAGWTKCRQHGLGKRSKGRLVARTEGDKWLLFPTMMRLHEAYST